MAYSDVLRNFGQIFICNMGPEVLHDVMQMANKAGIAPLKRTWNTKTVCGKWENYANECEGSVEKLLSK